MFDDAEVTAKLDGWDLNRWARHIAAKLLGSEALPPAPEGTPILARASSCPTPALPPTPAQLMDDARLEDYTADSSRRSPTRCRSASSLASPDMGLRPRHGTVRDGTGDAGVWERRRRDLGRRIRSTWTWTNRSVSPASRRSSRRWAISMPTWPSWPRNSKPSTRPTVASARPRRASPRPGQRSMRCWPAPRGAATEEIVMVERRRRRGAGIRAELRLQQPRAGADG